MKKTLFVLAVLILAVLAITAFYGRKSGGGAAAAEDGGGYKDIIAGSHDFTNIKITGGFLNIEIARGQEYRVKGIIADKKTLIAAIADGALQITQSAALCQKNACAGDVIKITVPAEFACDNTTINLTGGNIVLQNLVCGAVDLSTLSGNIEIAGASLSIANINTASGNVLMQDSEIAAADIKTASGNVSGRMVNFYEVYINTAAGDIGLEGEFKNTLNLTTDAGGISLDSSLSAADYYKEIETKRGAIYINGRHIGREHLAGGKDMVNRLIIVSAGGDINLRFAE